MSAKRRRPRKTYFPYAAWLGGAGGTHRLEIGRERGTHAELLKAAGLFATFDAAPFSFVMGRLLFIDDPTGTRPKRDTGILLLDTASDLFAGKTGVDMPLSRAVGSLVHAFEALVRRRFGGCRILLLEGGLRRRVSGIGPKDISALLDRKCKDPQIREL